MNLRIPRLRRDQAVIVALLQRRWRVVVCAGRRWGKTVMGGALALHRAAHGGAVAWIAPYYAQSRPLWRFTLQHVSPQIARINRAERIVEFSSGGRVSIYSADNADAVRGEAFDLVVIDEAARISEEAWSDAIMPTLADRRGRALLISTPRGRNWFWREWLQARDEGAAYHAPSYANPSPQIREAAERARMLVPERTYRQEWLAEFVEEGTLFPHVRELATAQETPYIASHAYCIGVDWARASGGDWTVFVVFDATARSVVSLRRYSGMPFDAQLAHLKSLWHAYGECPIVAESNAMGAPLIEAMQAQGLPVVPFATTPASKHHIITGLELAIEQRSIMLLNDEGLIAELEAYERQESRVGIPRYSAPAGMHDDCVIALALALHGASEYTGLKPVAIF